MAVASPASITDAHDPNSFIVSDILTTDEAAALLRVHPITLRKRATAWGVPHKRLGTEWRFSRKRLTEWLQAA